VNWKLPTVIILFLLAGWCYQQHEHINFNYPGSFWEQVDSKMERPWFKNNSRPEWQDHSVLKFLPFTWDGFHFFSSLMKFYFFLIFAIYLYQEEPYWWFVVFMGLAIGVLDLIVSKLTYGWFFQ